MDRTPDARITAALVSAGAALSELDARCCEPDRSPRLAALADRLAVVRSLVEAGAEPADVVAELEAAGAMVGELQVGCCAPNRLPLYADILRQLTTVQRVVTGVDR